MAVRTVSNSGKPTYGIREFFLDTEDDVALLPNYEEVGSIAFVISTGNIYIINSNHQWIKFE